MEQWARMKSFTLAAFLLSIASCSTAPTLRLDPGLVRPWSQDAWRDEPYRHPYLAVFKKGDLVLTYLATAHENQASSPTIRLLDQTFANGSFQAVMIEGLPFDSSRSEYEAYLRHVVRTSTGGFFPTSVEKNADFQKAAAKCDSILQKAIRRVNPGGPNQPATTTTSSSSST